MSLYAYYPRAWFAVVVVVMVVVLFATDLVKLWCVR